MASFLQNMFKPKWQHTDAQVRLEAINEALESDVILNLAENDSNLDVRLQALSLVSSLSDIARLFADKNKSVQLKARSLYIAIATGSEQPEDQIKNLMQVRSKYSNSTEILLTIACEASDAALSQAALDLVDDEAALFDFIMISNSSKARLKAAEKISISSMLKEIESHFKGKDKSLHRFAKNKLQAAIEAENQIQETKDKTASLLTQAENLSAQVFHPTFEGQLTYIKQEWSKAEFKEQLEDTFNKAIALCEDTLLKNKALQEKVNLENTKKIDSNTHYQSAIETLNSALKAFKQSGTPDHATVTSIINNAHDDWAKAESIFPASDSTKQDYQSHLDSITTIQNALSVLDKEQALLTKKSQNLDAKIQHKKSVQSALQQIKWPNQLQKPRTLEKFEALQEALSDAISSLQGSEKEHITETSQKLIDLERSIENGNLKQAQKIQSDIKKDLSLIERNHSKHIHSKFQLLSNQLNNLNDWKGFAAEPKFIELCEKMEALIDSELDISNLSQNIKDLQNNWKSLGSLGDKKQHDALWDRFKKASDKAYLPCQAHFKEMADIRKYNLQQRMEICEQLESLFQLQDWDHANWKALQKIIDKAFHEYKRFSPVDRSENSAIQKRFGAATLAIKVKLQGYYQENLQAKQALINQCSELLEHDDLAAAIQVCKTLQEQWKTIESAGKSEQSLWNQFREKCDALFERRSEEYNAQKSRNNELITQAQSIVDEARKLISSTDRGTLQLTAQFKQDIQALDIPEKVAIGKINDIIAIEKSIKQNIAKAANDQKQQSWITARNLSAELANQELHGEVDQEAWSTKLQTTDIPNEAKSAFTNRLNTQATTDAITLKHHCLDFEIAMGIESPSNDQSERMTLQIKRLQENMGKTQPSRAEALKQAQLTWFSYSASSDQYLELQSRFYGALIKCNGE